jgi:hypothetical protein
MSPDLTVFGANDVFADWPAAVAPVDAPDTFIDARLKEAKGNLPLIVSV